MDAAKDVARSPKREREAQQQMVRLHNAEAESRYLICDMEYSFRYEDPKCGSCLGRMDMVGARLPAEGDVGTRPRLALIELKWGPNAIDGSAGLQEHVRDLRGLLGRRDMPQRAQEMVKIVEQKHDLGLLPTTIADFDLDAPIEYIIAVAAHNPGSQRLRDALLGSEGRGESRLSWRDTVDAKVAILAPDLSAPAARGDDPLRGDYRGRRARGDLRRGHVKDRRPLAARQLVT